MITPDSTRGVTVTEEGASVAKSRVIGLDIGTTAVRAAEVEFASAGPAGTATPTLLRVGQVPLPRGAVRDGEVAEPETVASAIRQLWRNAGFSQREVVLGVGNQRVLVRDLDMPEMPMEQIRTSLPFQVQDLLPVAVEDALLDYFPTGRFTGPNGAMTSGLLVAATKDTVRANTMAVETASLRPLMVDLSAFALVRSQVRGPLADRTVALVDVGARVTTVVIVAGGQPRFVRLLATGGQDVTDAVSGEFNMPADEAETLKRTVGTGLGVAPEHKRAAATVTEVTANLVESVRNTMVYFNSANPGNPIEGALLTGGGSMLNGFGQYMASASRLPVQVGNPLATMRVSGTAAGTDHLTETPQLWATSIGLAYGVAA